MSPEDPNTPPPSGPNTPPPSGPNNSGLTGILGADIQSKQSCYALMFKIMGGILAVAGACCILLASLALGAKLAVPAGIVGGVGLLSGIGLFKAATKLPDTVVQQASPTLS